MKLLVVCVFLLGVMSYFPTAFADHAININTADKDALTTLTGIGEVKAQAILDYRAQNGPFATIEDIQNVSGIGPATYESIKGHITVQGGNATAPSPNPPPPSPTPQSSSGQTSPSQSPSQAASPSPGGLSVDAGNDRVTVVGADAEFLVRAYRDKKSLESAKFIWNFGDGSTGRGASVSHRFEYSGQYVVVVTGTSLEETASDRFIVTAEEAKLALRVLPDGGVEIEDLGARNIDLSRWGIKSEGSLFVLPDNSEVLAGQSLRVAPITLKFNAESSTELDYPDGTLAFRAGENAPTVEPSPASAEPSSSLDTSRATSIEEPDTYGVEKEDEKDDTAMEETATSSQVAAAAAANGSWTWWFAALGIAVAAGGAVYFARNYAKGEWDIIEDKDS